MAQEILLKRSSNVYETEASAWAALNNHTFKKGEPIVAFYTKSGSVHGDTSVAAIYAVGTDNGVGKYQAVASYEDFYALYTDLNSLKQKLDSMWEFDENGNLHTTHTIIVDGDGVFGGDYSGGGGTGEGGSSTLAGLNDVKDDGAGNVAGSSGAAASVGSLFAFNGTDWYAITRAELATGLKSSLIDVGIATEDYVNTAIQDAKDTRVDEIINTTIPALEEDIETAQGTADDAKGIAQDAQTKANKLIGNDSNKSVRDISKEVVAGLLEGADADFDTLIEIATYLESHSTDAIAMSNAIEALKKITKTFYNGGTVTEDSIKTYIDNAVKALKEGDVATAIDAINTLKAITISAGNGLTGGGNLTANRTLSVKADGDSIGVSANGVKVNTLDELTSTSTSKPLSANQGKVLKGLVDAAQGDIDTLEAKGLTAGTATATSGTLLGGAQVDVKYDNSSVKVNSSNQLYVSVIDGGTF